MANTTNKNILVKNDGTPIVLNKVDTEAYKKCIVMLKQNYNKADLEIFVHDVKLWLKGRQVLQRFDDGTTSSYLSIDSFFAIKKTLREDIEKFLALIFCDAYNFGQFLQAYPEDLRELMLSLLKNLYLSADELYTTPVGKKYLQHYDTWRRECFDSPCPFFSFYFTYTKTYNVKRYYDSFVFLKSSLYPYLYDALIPQKSVVKVVDELPEHEDLKVMETEREIIKFFPLIFSLYKTKILVLGNGNKFLMSTLRTCSKQVVWQEFYPESENADLKYLRSNFAFTLLYCKFLSVPSEEDSYPDIKLMLKENLNKLIYLIVDFLPLFVSNIKGLKKDNLSSSHIIGLLDYLQEILCDYSTGNKWISIDTIIDQILREEKGFVNFHLFYDIEILRWKSTLKFGNNTVSLVDMYDKVTIPFLKSVLMMLASVGLLDVAYSKFQPDLTKNGVSDGLRYVRLTEFGKFILGMTDSYDAPETNEDIELFDLDAERLIVRSVNELNPFLSFLKNVATDIGNNRYLFTYESFMKNSQSKEDIQQNIDFAKCLFDGQLTTVWNAFFEQLMLRSEPVQNLKSSDYVIFKVNAEDKELIHLLNTDTLLRKWVIRAEGFLILVKDINLKNFKTRMKALGYLF